MFSMTKITNKRIIKRTFTYDNNHISSCKIPPNPNNDDDNFWIYYLFGISAFYSLSSLQKKEKATEKKYIYNYQNQHKNN